MAAINLSCIDQFNFYRNTHKAYSCIITGIRLTENITPDQVVASLSELVAQRRVLCLNVIDGRVQEVSWDVSRSVETLQAKDLGAALDQIHETVFQLNVQTPLWKIVLVNSEWILFACDHLFCDGTTAVMVLEDLILLHKGQAIEPDKYKRDEFVQHIQPPRSFVLKVIIQKIVDGLASYFSRPSSTNSSNSDDTFKADRFILEVPQVSVLKIKEFTKKENITFTTMMALLNVYAVSKLTGSSGVTISIPINQRRFLGDPRSYGSFVSALDLSVSSLTSLDQLKHKLKITEKSMRSSAYMVGMLGYIDVEKYVISKMGLSPDPTKVEISNLGLRESVSGIQDYLFSQPKSKIMKHLGNSVVGSANGVTVCMSYGYGSELFDEYKHLMTRLITEVGQRGASFSLDDCVKIFQGP